MHNPYILIPAVAWLVAQIAKFSLLAFRGRLDYKLFYASGGMPSAHAAVVSALAVTTLLLNGSSSAIFGLALVVAAIVIYDSLGVRRATGEQGQAINQLLDVLEAGKAVPLLSQSRLRTVMGHTPAEVAVGTTIGVVLAGLFNFDHLSGLINFVTTIPGRIELVVYAALVAILWIIGLVWPWKLRRDRPGSTAYRKFGRMLLIRTQIWGWVTVVFLFAAFEQALYLGWRLWPILLLGLGWVWVIALILRWSRRLPAETRAEDEQARLAKWLRPKHKARKRR